MAKPALFYALHGSTYGPHRVLLVEITSVRKGWRPRWYGRVDGTPVNGEGYGHGYAAFSTRESAEAALPLVEAKRKQYREARKLLLDSLEKGEADLAKAHDAELAALLASLNPIRREKD